MDGVVIVIYVLAISVVWPAILFAIVSFPLGIWRRRQRLKQAGLIKHRVRFFAWRFYSEKIQRAVAAKLDPRALVWAIALPDHKPRAKQIARQELIRRGYTPAQIAGWSPSARELTVPPVFRAAVTWDKYMRMTKAKARLFQIYRAAIVLLIPATVLMGSLFEDGKARDAILQLTFGGLCLSMIELAVLCGVLYRKRALRILLLRPFGEKRMTKALKRFVPNSIGRIGHVYTLSDRSYRPNPVLAALLMIPLQGLDLLVLFILTPFIRNSLRVASIRKERSFRRFERFLIRQFRPSYWSFLNGGQAFNIRCSDPWWQMCIRMLMQSCEIIVIDLSKVKQGTAWELGELHAKLLLSKCVFIVAQDQRAEGAAMLAHHWPDTALPRVFVYRANGKLVEQASFEAYLGSRMAPHLAIAQG